jgi:hypothetical protein
MHKLLPLFILSVCGLAVSPLISTLPLIAHQMNAAGSVGAMIHLEPNDSPFAGKNTMTWFMLTRQSGEMIAPKQCDCKVMALDANEQPIVHHLPLTTMQLAGHQAGHEAIRTDITFPKAGAYTVVLTGKSKDNSFDPFELKFPITVRP